MRKYMYVCVYMSERERERGNREKEKRERKNDRPLHAASHRPKQTINCELREFEEVGRERNSAQSE